jgi:hypothetical protein
MAALLTLGDQAEDLPTPRRQRVEGLVVAEAAGHHQRHHLRVQGGSPRADPPQLAAEGRDVENALLEQVADAGGVVGEQLDGVAALDELRQHHDRRARSKGSDTQRGPQAVVGTRGWHPDVGENQVRFLDRGHGHE